jgi:hypothetical protein
MDLAKEGIRPDSIYGNHTAAIFAAMEMNGK